MTLGSLNINLPASPLLPSARGTAASGTAGVLDDVDAVNSRGRATGDREQLAQDVEQQRDPNPRRVTATSQILEPVLELDDLPTGARSAISTYLSTQNTITPSAQGTSAANQSIVGVDVFV